eukprot:scaffold128_cov328-Pavlova_lutheri.AAC.47
MACTAGCRFQGPRVYSFAWSICSWRCSVRLQGFPIDGGASRLIGWRSTNRCWRPQEGNHGNRVGPRRTVSPIPPRSKRIPGRFAGEKERPWRMETWWGQAGAAREGLCPSCVGWCSMGW